MKETKEPRGYVIALFRYVELGPEIWSYMESIEATFEPFGGEWCIHGTSPHALEGDWPGDIVMISFPTMTAAREWYLSPEYQAILPLRTAHSEATVALVAGVPDGYEATETVAKLKTATTG